MSELIEQEDRAPVISGGNISTPADLIRVAIQTGTDVAQLERLMDMQLKWDANEARKAYVKAVSAFRSEAPTIARTSKAHNSKYAKIDQITETVNPLLAKHGLSFSWSTEQNETITVHCDVTHVDGHSQRVSLSAAPDGSGSKNAIQAIGSTVSYLQRYTLLSALGLATGEMDNDANIPPDTSAFAKEVEQLESCKDLPELRAVWTGLSVEARKALEGVKERMKADLS